MNRIARFEKVSYERFSEDFMKEFPDFSEEKVKMIYDGIRLPVRATKGSAGYDFRATLDFTLEAGEEIKVPTGIRVTMREDFCLMVFPRSSLGFKYRLQMNNTVGIIDSDYYFTANEGHIFIKITNDSKEGKSVNIRLGDAFAQGLFIQYGITEDDDVTEQRIGGIGSTSPKQQ